nr:hypothetical protein [uncultured bacterium]
MSQPRHETEREQRIATELEEVVVDADGFDLQKLRPQRGERDFELGARRDEGHGDLGALTRRRRQCAAVDLPARRARPIGHGHERGRHHVVGQARRDERAKGLRKARGVTFGRDVRNEPLVARFVFANDDDRLPHLLVLLQRDFDFAELDSVTANLHLVIDAADELDLAVLSAPNEIARSIQPAAFRDGKLRRGEVISAEVTAREHHAADEQLTFGSVGYGVSSGVENVKRRAVDGRADGWKRRPRARGPLERERRHHVRLARAVVIEEPTRRHAFEESNERRRHFELLAGGHHLAQRRRRTTLRIGGLGEPLQRNERHEDALDALAFDEAQKLGRVEPHLVANEHQRAARSPGRPHLLEMHVEGQRRELQRAPRRDVRLRELPTHEVRERPATHRHALRLTRRARRVDDVRQVVFVRRRLNRRRGVRSEAMRFGVDEETRAVVRRQRRRELRMSDEHRWPRILEHVREPLLGVRRVERNVRTARLEHGDDADRQIERALDADGNGDVGPHAELSKQVCESVRLRVELAIRQTLAAVGDCYGIHHGR